MSELKKPEPYMPEANWRIHQREDLERTGIFGELEHRINIELGLDDELENYYYIPEYTPFEIAHIKMLILEHPHHTYSVLLKEKIQDYEIKTPERDD